MTKRRPLPARFSTPVLAEDLADGWPDSRRSELTWVRRPDRHPTTDEDNGDEEPS